MHSTLCFGRPYPKILVVLAAIVFTLPGKVSSEVSINLLRAEVDEANNILISFEVLGSANSHRTCFVRDMHGVGIREIETT